MQDLQDIRTIRHRLDRGGYRQLNCALHRLAVTKGRPDPDTAAYLEHGATLSPAGVRPATARG